MYRNKKTRISTQPIRVFYYLFKCKKEDLALIVESNQIFIFLI